MLVGDAIEVLTIGHSTLTYEAFLDRLRAAQVTAVADVRTSPFSRRLPQFNREVLRAELRSEGISYVFLGKELGGRPSDLQYYSGGVADYEKMATAEIFQKGLDRVVEGARQHRIAMMCSESDPMDCHRCLLVGRALVKRGIKVTHILPHARTMTQSDVEERLLELSGRSAEDFFVSREERLTEAYRDRARKVAFAEPLADPEKPIAAEQSS
jgi:uncharacterized protein (DUF488 family)